MKTIQFSIYIALLSMFCVVPTAIAEGGSCQGKYACGGPGSNGYQCYCDASCERFGDCCEDKEQYCDAGSSCQGFMGEQAPSGCWCDAACLDQGDCCNDFQDVANTVGCPANQVTLTVPIYAVRTSASEPSPFRVVNPNAVPISTQEIKQWIDESNRILEKSCAGIILEYDPSSSAYNYQRRTNLFLDHYLSDDRIHNMKTGNAPCDSNREMCLDAAESWVEQNEAMTGGKLVLFFRNSGGNGFARSNFFALGKELEDGSNGPENMEQLAHDFAHFLNLEHTFPGDYDFLDLERQDGTPFADEVKNYLDHANRGEHRNQVLALDGDGLHDTPAWPGPSFVENQTGEDRCRIGGFVPVETHNGTRLPVRVPQEYMMSYLAKCGDKHIFSPHQVQKLRRELYSPAFCKYVKEDLLCN